MNRSMHLIAAGLLLALSSGLATAQAVDPAPEPALPYRLLDLPEDEVVLGISPDSLTVVTGAAYPDCLRFYRTEDLSLAAEAVFPDGVALPKEKKALWSRDGKFVALRSCQRSPWEFKNFKSSCVFAVEAATGAFTQLCDDRFKEKFSIKNPNLYFDPGFGPGEGKALFHTWNAEGTKIVSVDMKGGKESVLYADPLRNESLYAYPLFVSFVLLNVAPNNTAVPYNILVLDSRGGKTRSVLSGKMDGGPSIFEVLDVAADGKTALVSGAVLVPKSFPGIDVRSLHILSFDGNGVPTEKRLDAPDGYRILAARLSPDARAIALVVKRAEPAEGAEPLASVLKVDLEEESVETLLSDSDPVMVPGVLPAKPGFGIPQGLFLSSKNLLISCADGFRLYALE